MPSIVLGSPSPQPQVGSSTILPSPEIMDDEHEANESGLWTAEVTYDDFSDNDDLIANEAIVDGTPAT
jgi:hypothetical protein